MALLINFAISVVSLIVGGATGDFFGRAISVAPVTYLDSLIFTGIRTLVGAAVGFSILVRRVLG
jgi:hypothetical protein